MVEPAFSGIKPNSRRQDIPDSYWLNGLCYAARREVLFDKQLVIPEGSVAVVVERDVANIDGWEDLEFAETLVSRSDGNT